ELAAQLVDGPALDGRRGELIERRGAQVLELDAIPPAALLGGGGQVDRHRGGVADGEQLLDVGPGGEVGVHARLPDARRRDDAQHRRWARVARAAADRRPAYARGRRGCSRSSIAGAAASSIVTPVRGSRGDAR